MAHVDCPESLSLRTGSAGALARADPATGDARAGEGAGPPMYFHGPG
jgi:hypothetical protein